jgi:hypothetical protein
VVDDKLINDATDVVLNTVDEKVKQKYVLNIYELN